MLTDEEIAQIAAPYRRLIGDHWSCEWAMHEDNFDEFARDIEKAVIEKMGEPVCTQPE